MVCVFWPWWVICDDRVAVGCCDGLWVGVVAVFGGDFGRGGFVGANDARPGKGVGQNYCHLDVGAMKWCFGGKQNGSPSSCGPATASHDATNHFCLLCPQKCLLFSNFHRSSDAIAPVQCFHQKLQKNIVKFKTIFHLSTFLIIYPIF